MANSRLRLEGPRSGQYVGMAKSWVKALETYINTNGTFEKFIPIGPHEPEGYVHLRHLGNMWDVFIFTADTLPEVDKKAIAYPLRLDHLIHAAGAYEADYIETRVGGSWDVTYAALADVYAVLDEDKKDYIEWPPLEGTIPDYRKLVAQGRLQWSGPRLITIDGDEYAEGETLYPCYPKLLDAPNPPDGFVQDITADVLGGIICISGVWYVTYNTVHTPDAVMCIAIPCETPTPGRTTTVYDEELDEYVSVVVSYRLESLGIGRLLAEPEAGRVGLYTAPYASEVFNSPNTKAIVFDGSYDFMEAVKTPFGVTQEGLEAFYTTPSVDTPFREMVPLKTAYRVSMTEAHEDADSPVEGLGQHVVGAGYTIGASAPSAMYSGRLTRVPQIYPSIEFPIAQGATPGAELFSTSVGTTGSSGTSHLSVVISPSVKSGIEFTATRAVCTVGDDFLLEHKAPLAEPVFSSVTTSQRASGSGPGTYIQISETADQPAFSFSSDITLVNPKGGARRALISWTADFASVQASATWGSDRSRVWTDMLTGQGTRDIGPNYALTGQSYIHKQSLDMSLPFRRRNSAKTYRGKVFGEDVVGAPLALLGGIHDLPVEVASPFRYVSTATEEVYNDALNGVGVYGTAAGIWSTEIWVRVNGSIISGDVPSINGLWMYKVPYNVSGLDNVSNVAHTSLYLNRGYAKYAVDYAPYTNLPDSSFVFSFAPPGLPSISSTDDYVALHGMATTRNIFLRTPDILHIKHASVDTTVDTTHEVVFASSPFSANHSVTGTSEYLERSEYQIGTSYKMAISGINILRNITNGKVLIYKASIGIIRAKVEYLNIWWIEALNYIVTNVSALIELLPDEEGHISELFDQAEIVMGAYLPTLDVMATTNTPASRTLVYSSTQAAGVFTRDVSTGLTTIILVGEGKVTLNRADYEYILAHTNFEELTKQKEAVAEAGMLAAVSTGVLYGSVAEVAADPRIIAGMFRFGRNMAFV